MTVPPPEGCTGNEPDRVREQLSRILSSRPFQQSQRRRRFLEYLVEETLAGRGDRLKAYAIAVAVFERPESFDPVVDPLVRIEAGRLRDKLREYYATEGKDDPILIELRKGSYSPHIVPAGEAETKATAAPALLQPEDDGSATDGPAVPGAAGRRQLGLLAAAAAAIVAAGLWAGSGWDIRPALPDKPSIAVLPFDNIGHDPKWERFADGITEDIITDLSHSRDLVVIARSSTEAYKSKSDDVRRIGTDLNVKYVLEGSIQELDRRIRVTAQLIDAATGGHVWSERYDRPIDDLFEVQNSVTQRIAATLGGYEGAVAEAERRLVRRKPPASLTAFDTYLLAMEAKHKVTKESLFEAERLFNKALELDPQLARAHVGLADTQFYLIDLGLAPSVDEAIAKMMRAGEAGVALDPDDGKTHYALGLGLMYRGKGEQAMTAFARAEALAPSDADLLLCIAWSIASLGQPQRAVALAERALELNPHYPDWYNQGLSYVFFFGEQYERSVKHRLLVKQPLAVDYAYLAVSYAYLGQPHEAAAARVRTLDPKWVAERYLSEAGGYPEKQAEQFVEGARKAGLPACVDPASLKGMPNLIRVRSCDAERARISG